MSTYGRHFARQVQAGTLLWLDWFGQGMGSVTGLTPAPPLRAGDRVACGCQFSAADDIKCCRALLCCRAGASTLNLRPWPHDAGAISQVVMKHAIPICIKINLRRCSAVPAWMGCCPVAGAAHPLAKRLAAGVFRWLALLWARMAAGFGGGIHGPLLTTLAAEPNWSRDRLRRLLFGESIPDLQGEGWGGGTATAPLVVANLTVATHLLGSRFVPELQGAILILEDVGEAPYRVDRMLTQWRLNGSLQGLSGIGFGSFTACEGEDEPDASECFSVEQVLDERTADLGIPRVRNLALGHGPGNAALPMGAMAHLDGQSGRLSLLT